jgi:DnaJ-class molecular chaperone
MAPNDDPLGYYRVLGLAPNATQAQIQHAYRLWAKAFHPDTSGNSDASDFRRIKEAYDTLSDQSLKQKYDQLGLEESRVVVTNAGDSDAVVKFRDINGSVIVSFS